MKFLDLFSGIGGFRLGMEMAGHECVGHIEINKYSNKSYQAMHNPKEDEFYGEDITGITDKLIWDNLGGKGIDIICGGFPCQAFSLAGKRKGFEDTRGTLFFDVARFAKVLKPKYLFLENVKGLLNHDGGNTFETILRALDEIGYDAEWQVCNSKYFGVAQNRERVFIVGHLRGASGCQIFPLSRADGQAAMEVKLLTDIDGNSHMMAIPVSSPDMVNKKQNGKRFKEDGEPMFTLTAMDRHGVVIKNPEIKVLGTTNPSRHSDCDIHGTDGIIGTLLGRDYKEPKKILVPNANKQGYDIAEEGDSIHMDRLGSTTRRGRVGKGVAQTLDTACNQGVIVNNEDSFVIRKLTPKECFRLQGFPDSYFEKAQAVNSDSQLYKQAGNSVTVNVIYAIAKKLK